MNKRQRKKVLGIIGVALAALTFTFDKMVGEPLKAEHDDLEKVEKQFTESLGPEMLQFQILMLQQELQKMDVKQEKQKPERKQDYSTEILEDGITIRNFVANLKTSLETTATLLKRIDHNTRDLQKTLDSDRPTIEKTIDGATTVIEPSDAHDWDRAVSLKAELVVVIVSRLEVLVIAAYGIGRLEREQERLAAAHQLCNYLIWAFGLLSFGLTGYGILAGLDSDK